MQSHRARRRATVVHTPWRRRLIATAQHITVAMDASETVEEPLEFVAPVRLGGPRVSHGRGIYVWDQDGNKYIDGSGGPAGVFSLGHAHPEVTQAAKDQLDKIAFGYTKYFSSDPAAELTKLIGELAGGSLNNVVYCGGGSEAVESCLKIALQCQVARGYTNRARFVRANTSTIESVPGAATDSCVPCSITHQITRDRSYHGDSLGAAAISGMSERRALFQPALAEVSWLSPVNPYRPPLGVAAEKLAKHCAAELEAEILRCGPENVCAFVMEPIVGSAGGAIVPPEGYGRLVREICTKYGVLLIADEIVCGCGRTGTWRASEQMGFVPDIMSVAKGLAAGVIPLAAAIYNDEIFDIIKENHGAVATGHTFTGHTAACAAGLATQQVIARDGLVSKIKTQLGPYLFEQLHAIIGHLPYVGEIRGRGLLAGIELVANRETKQPFHRSLGLGDRMTAAAFNRRMLCYPMGGQNVDGIEGAGYSDHVLIAPAYIATEPEIHEIVMKLKLALADVFGESDVIAAMEAAS